MSAHDPASVDDAGDGPPVTAGSSAQTLTQPPDRPVTASDAALARYSASMRRPRLVYAAVISAIVIVLIVVVSVAWSRGEVANTTLHTVATAPPTLPVSAPSSVLQLAWRTTDKVALGVPQWGGTVVVSSTHTVRGVNARTGAQTWSYTRSNRRVCTAAQLAGVTIAVFQVKGNCDELTALDSQTGERKWTRTLAFDGRPLNGQAAYQVTPSTFMISSSSVIYSIDPVSSYNRFTYTRYGCTIRNAVLGTGGVLISQTCANPVCEKQKFCGKGPQLLLRATDGDRDNDSTTNPDKIVWSKMGSTDVPVSADDFTSALNTTTRALDVFDSVQGTSLGTVQLAPKTSSPDRIDAVNTQDAELVWIGGTAYAIAPGPNTIDWAAPSSGPPTVVAADGVDPAQLKTARVTVSGAVGVRLLNGSTGRSTTSLSPPTPPPSGSIVYPLGTGVLVTSNRGASAYR